ncbi:cytochrome P450 (plasmid) [Coraliomargarita sp. W4R53]
MKSWFRTPHPETTNVDISSIDFWSQPFESREVAFARLRAEAPVSWHRQLETPGLRHRSEEAGFWAVTKVRDIAFVSKNHDLFSSEIGQVGVRPAPFRLDPNMLVVDPPHHTDLRRIVSGAFTPRSLRSLEESIRRNAHRIVLRAARHESFDFVNEVSALLPLLTIATLIGVPESERERFVAAADAHVRGGIPGDLPPGVTPEQYFAEQARYLNELCAALAEWRRTNPGEDLMTHLVQAEIDGKALSPAEIFSTVMMLIVAGSDTTKQEITLSMIALERFPEQKAWLIADFEQRFDLAFNELVRFASPVVSFARTATQDVELAGAAVTAGDKVALFYCSGNRDEDEFTDPGALDLTRPASAHVAFGGGGVHYCLGSRLAQVEVKSMLREIFTLLPGLTLGEPQYGFGESVHSVTSLPARRPR